MSEYDIVAHARAHCGKLDVNCMSGDTPICVMQEVPCYSAMADKIERLRAALNIIRHQWAGHSEVCRSYLDPHDICDCDWPSIAKQCDEALSSVYKGDSDE